MCLVVHLVPSISDPAHQTALESVPSSILVAVAFPVAPYVAAYNSPHSNDSLKQISGFRQLFSNSKTRLLVSMKDTVNPTDIIQDVVHNFSSRYRGYAQYHNIQVNFKIINLSSNLYFPKGAALTLPESSDNRITVSDDEQLI